MSGHVQLLLQILEGVNFHHLESDSSLIFKGILDRVTLSSDPIPLSSVSGLRLDIGEEMIWKMSHRNFKRIKTTKALKLECFNTKASGACINIGYIILNLKIVTDSSKSTRDWYRLLGSSMNSHSCPQLLLSIYYADEKAESQRLTSSPEPEILDMPKSVSQLVLKNGLTYIGPERSCHKRFQLSCDLHTASNLNLLVPTEKSTLCKKAFHLRLLVLGQHLNSHTFQSLESHTDFHQTFVFDVASSVELLEQYLRENLFVELELVSGELLLGRCKQYTDSLQLGTTVHLTCLVSQHDTSTLVAKDSQSYPSVDISISLHALDLQGKYLTTAAPAQNNTKATKVVTPRQIDMHILVSDEMKQQELYEEEKEKLAQIPHGSNNINNNTGIMIEFCNGGDKTKFCQQDSSTSHKTLLEEVPLRSSEYLNGSEDNLKPCVEGNKEVSQAPSPPVLAAVAATAKSAEAAAPQLSDLPLDSVKPDAAESCKSLSSLGGVSSAKPPSNHGDPDPASRLNVTDLKHTHIQNFPATDTLSERISNSEILTKIVEELEEWKFRQKILFAEDLKKQKESLVARWEAERRLSAEQKDKERQEVVERTKQLALQLQRELFTLQHKAEELASEEVKFKNLSKTLQEKHSKVSKLLHQQSDASKKRIDDLTLGYKQLQQQIVILQHENQRLKNKAQKSESAKLAKMEEKVQRVLQKKVLEAHQGKTAKVKNCEQSQKEVATSLGGQEHLSDKSDSRKHRLQAALEEESSQLLGERSQLEQLRLELDSLALARAAAVAGPSAEEGDKEEPLQLLDTPHTQLCRLQQEREDLLLSGMYMSDNELIQALDQAIASAQAFHSN